jgi:hypothetical protein
MEIVKPTYVLYRVIYVYTGMYIYALALEAAAPALFMFWLQA